MLGRKELQRALSTIRLISAHGPWFRVVAYKHLLEARPGMMRTPEPLWGGAARIAGARFTPKGSYSSIYMALDPITAFTEVSALIALPAGPVPIRSAPWVLVTVDGMLGGVLDLTDTKTLLALGTTEQEVTGTWVTGSEPPTQILGQVAFDDGKITGIKYASAKNLDGRNLVVFSERVAGSERDYLQVFDPHGNLVQRIP
jgi:RES domain-containing protein